MAILLAAPYAHAGLIGDVTVSILFPASSTIFNGATDSLAVGSSLSCPGSSHVCTAGFFGVSEDVTFSATSGAISFSQGCCIDYSSAAFNGYEFSNLDFADSGTLASATLGSISGFAQLTQSDVTIVSGDIFVNLQEFVDPSGGSFTLTLTETSGGTTVPEPGTAVFAGSALLAMLAAFRMRERC